MITFKNSITLKYYNKIYTSLYLGTYGMSNNDNSIKNIEKLTNKKLRLFIKRLVSFKINSNTLPPVNPY